MTGRPPGWAACHGPSVATRPRPTVEVDNRPQEAPVSMPEPAASVPHPHSHGPAPARAPQVAQVLDELAARLAHLDDRLQLLVEARLGSVLRSEEATPDTPPSLAAASPALVPLADRLDDQVRAANRMIRRVESALDRLEL